MGTNDNNNESTTCGSLASLWSEEIPHEIFTEVLEIFLKELQKIDTGTPTDSEGTFQNFPQEAYDILKIFEIISNSRR